MAGDVKKAPRAEDVPRGIVHRGKWKGPKCPTRGERLCKLRQVRSKCFLSVQKGHLPRLLTLDHLMEKAET